MEKGEIAHFEQFHHFPQCFSKAFSFNVLNVYIRSKELIDRRSTNQSLTARQDYGLDKVEAIASKKLDEAQMMISAVLKGLNTL